MGARGLPKVSNGRAIRRASPLFLLLIFSAILFAPPAHAGSPSLVYNNHVNCSADPCTFAFSPVQQSEIIAMAQFVRNGCASGGFTMTDTLGNAYAQQQFVDVSSGGGTEACIYAVAAFSANSGSDTITIHGCFDCRINFLNYASFVAFGASATFSALASSGTDTRTLSIQSGSIVIGLAITEQSTVTCGNVATGSGQQVLDTFACLTVSGAGSASGFTHSSLAQAGPSYSDIITWSGGNGAGGGGFGRFVMELQGPGSSGGNLTTQCYGNCGVPPVTLANTNSTHTVNFNLSLTLFYRFQSALNGFVNNVTVSSARVQPSTMTLTIGTYLAPNCQNGQTPFSSQCPGFLQSSQAYGPLAKQQYSQNSNLAVHLGDWIGISVSANFAKLDLNDTNSPVPLYYTSGFTPAQISQSALYDSASKVGIWAFITGNVATGGSTSSPGCGTPACGAQAFVGALGGGLFGGIAAFGLLFGIIAGSLLYATRQHDEQGHIRGYALPTWFLGLIAIMLLIGLSSLGLLPVWIPLVIILLVAWLFTSSIWSHRRHEGGTGGNL